MIPTHEEVGRLLENLVNTSSWLHIDHDDSGKQRVALVTNDGRVIGESAAFIGEALRAAWARSSAQRRCVAELAEDGIRDDLDVVLPSPKSEGT